MPLEIEAKLELTEEFYRDLLATGEVRSDTSQVNVYYDEGWALADRGITFRVRFVPNKFSKLTFKIPRHFTDSGTRTADEIEGHARLFLGPRSAPRRIDVAGLDPSLRSSLDPLGLTRLDRVGWVRNRRVVLVRRKVGEIVLDRLRLPDGSTYFEAEVEHHDPDVVEEVAARLAALRPDHARPSTVSKFERFRRALGRR